MIFYCKECHEIQEQGCFRVGCNRRQEITAPELPDPDRVWWQWGREIKHYTADQMRRYALTAVKLALGDAKTPSPHEKEQEQEQEQAK
jgi:hypothetical protein